VVYLHAKFEVSSFPRYGGGPKIFKVHHVTPSLMLPPPKLSCGVESRT